MRYFYLSAAALLLVGGVTVGCKESTETVTDRAVTDPVHGTSVHFANSKCPIMGGKPRAELTAQYDGKPIGFCCDGCPEKWAALSAEEKAETFTKVDAHDGHNQADGTGDANHLHADDADDAAE